MSTDLLLHALNAHLQLRLLCFHHVDVLGTMSMEEQSLATYFLHIVGRETRVDQLIKFFVRFLELLNQIEILCTARYDRSSSAI